MVANNNSQRINRNIAANICLGVVILVYISFLSLGAKPTNDRSYLIEALGSLELQLVPASISAALDEEKLGAERREESH